MRDQIIWNAPARDERESTTVRSDRNASAAVAGDFRHMLTRAFFEGLDAALAPAHPERAE